VTDELAIQWHLELALPREIIVSVPRENESNGLEAARGSRLEGVLEILRVFELAVQRERAGTSPPRRIVRRMM
jgi:hypothetical protein